MTDQAITILVHCAWFLLIVFGALGLCLAIASAFVSGECSREEERAQTIHGQFESDSFTAWSWTPKLTWEELEALQRSEGEQAPSRGLAYWPLWDDQEEERGE